MSNKIDRPKINSYGRNEMDDTERFYYQSYSNWSDFHRSDMRRDGRGDVIQRGNFLPAGDYTARRYVNSNDALWDEKRRFSSSPPKNNPEGGRPPVVFCLPDEARPNEAPTEFRTLAPPRIDSSFVRASSPPRQFNSNELAEFGAFIRGYGPAMRPGVGRGVTLRGGFGTGPRFMQAVDGQLPRSRSISPPTKPFYEARLSVPPVPQMGGRVPDQYRARLAHLNSDPNFVNPPANRRAPVAQGGDSSGRRRQDIEFRDERAYDSREDRSSDKKAKKTSPSTAKDSRSGYDSSKTDKKRSGEKEQDSFSEDYNSLSKKKKSRSGSTGKKKRLIPTCREVEYSDESDKDNTESTGVSERILNEIVIKLRRRDSESDSYGAGSKEKGNRGSPDDSSSKNSYGKSTSSKDRKSSDSSSGRNRESSSSRSFTKKRNLMDDEKYTRSDKERVTDDVHSDTKAFRESKRKYGGLNPPSGSTARGFDVSPSSDVRAPRTRQDSYYSHEADPRNFGRSGQGMFVQSGNEMIKPRDRTNSFERFDHLHSGGVDTKNGRMNIVGRPVGMNSGGFPLEVGLQRSFDSDTRGGSLSPRPRDFPRHDPGPVRMYGDNQLQRNQKQLSRVSPPGYDTVEVGRRDSRAEGGSQRTIKPKHRESIIVERYSSDHGYPRGNRKSPNLEGSRFNNSMNPMGDVRNYDPRFQSSQARDNDRRYRRDDYEFQSQRNGRR